MFMTGVKQARRRGIWTCKLRQPNTQEVASCDNGFPLHFLLAMGNYANSFSKVNP